MYLHVCSRGEQDRLVTDKQKDYLKERKIAMALVQAPTLTQEKEFPTLHIASLPGRRSFLSDGILSFHPNKIANICSIV